MLYAFYFFKSHFILQSLYWKVSSQVLLTGLGGSGNEGVGLCEQGNTFVILSNIDMPLQFIL